MDLELAVIVNNEYEFMTLREFGGDNMLCKVDMLVGDSTFDNALQLWVRCAMFLGRHLEHPVPACMQPLVRKFLRVESPREQ